MNGIKRLASFLVVASVAMGMFNAYGDGEVIVSAIDNANRTATITFAAAEEGQRLVFAYGKSDYGQDLKEWTRNANLAEYALAVGATSLTVTLPEAWGTTAFCGRFLIKVSEPLPVDALLDYVETRRYGSAGTYIRTGISPNQDTCVEMDFAMTGISGWQTLFCARTSKTSFDQFTCSLDASANGRYDNKSVGSGFTAFLSSTPGTRYVLKSVGNTLTAYKQSDLSEVNTLIGGNSGGVTFTAPEMILFMAGEPTSKAPTANSCSLRFYSFKVRDGEDGQLLADYVPAKSNSVAGIYDYVSNKFIPSANPTYPFDAGSVVEENPTTETALAWSEPQVGFAGLIGMGGRIFPALDGSGDVVHVFDAAGDYEFTAPAVDIELHYLIVGGGGAGGRGAFSGGSAGGGGGGGVISNVSAVGVLPKTKLQIKVGAGGVFPESPDPVRNYSGLPGGDSSIRGLDAEEALVALGGGGGRECSSASSSLLYGGDGGNGGGGAYQGAPGGKGLQTGVDANGDLVIVGHDGGTGANAKLTGGGGGGGAGEVGQAYSGEIGGRGGDGAKSNITGEEVCYGGGGGGGNYNGANNANRGGYGGGGYGAAYGSDAAEKSQAGADGFGGGGGGGGDVAANGGNDRGANGGAGCVIIRYHPPENSLCGLFDMVDAGPAYIRFACQLTSLGPVGDAVRLEVASGADAEHLGPFQVLSESWQEGETFDYAATGLEVGQSYCFHFRITNLEDNSVFEREVSAATTGLPADGGEAVYQLPNDWMVHVFTTPGTYDFTVPYGGIALRYLIVGGGGAGGGATQYNGGGGGGGGGVLTNDCDHPTLAIPGGVTLTIKVGGGGAAVVNHAGGTGEVSSVAAEFGETSMNLIALGGGGGAYNTDNNGFGGDGANGGGGTYKGNQSYGGGGVAQQMSADGYGMGSTIIGFAGGNGTHSSLAVAGAGGGGAGQVGGTPPTTSHIGGIGGNGAWSDITGKSVCYGGGGGGGAAVQSSVLDNADGGLGGGGNGGCWHGFNVLATAGTDGLGGGGGGGGGGSKVADDYWDGANGGSGIVVLSYLPSTDLPDEPIGNLSGIEIKDVKVKGDATNVVEEVAYKVEWAGNGADFADVSVVYGASPDALTKEKPLAKNVIGSGTGVCKLTQSWKEGREYYVALKITSGAGKMVTEPVQVSLPKRIPPQFPAVIVR